MHNIHILCYMLIDIELEIYAVNSNYEQWNDKNNQTYAVIFAGLYSHFSPYSRIK